MDETNRTDAPVVSDAEYKHAVAVVAAYEARQAAELAQLRARLAALRARRAA